MENIYIFGVENTGKTILLQLFDFDKAKITIDTYKLSDIAGIYCVNLRHIYNVYNVLGIDKLIKNNADNLNNQLLFLEVTNNNMRLCGLKMYYEHILYFTNYETRKNRTGINKKIPKLEKFSLINMIETTKKNIYSYYLTIEYLKKYNVNFKFLNVLDIEMGTKLTSKYFDTYIPQKFSIKEKKEIIKADGSDKNDIWYKDEIKKILFDNFKISIDIDLEKIKEEFEKDLVNAQKIRIN